MTGDNLLNTNERERIRKHYELEKSLAAKIRASSPAERARVTREAYRTLYESIPWHISRQKTHEQVRFEIEYNMAYLLPLLKRTDKVLELGCGTGRTINALGPYIRLGLGIDATLLNAEPQLHPNVRLQEGDVSRVDQDEKGFDLVFSLHLIEHLHPDDFRAHLTSMFEHLTSGGSLFVVTPNALTGPHDISKHFDEYATGFHLKEYTYRELASLLRDAGFVDVRAQMLPRRVLQRMGFLYRLGLTRVFIPIILENTLLMLPSRRLQRKLGEWIHLKNVFIFARKP